MNRAARLLVALLVWGVLSFGAVYAWGYWPLAIGAGTLGLWTAITTRAWREPRPRAVAWALGAVALALLIQLTPLPYAWFKQVSPAADRLLSQLQLGWSAQPPAWHSLSVASDATVTALVLLLAFGVLLVGLMRAVSYMPLGWIVGQLTAFGCVLAVFGVVQRVVAGPSDVLVYGFWRPQDLATPFGPFINRNHFAGWMAMMLPLAVAAATASVLPARGSPVLHGRGRLRWLLTPDANRFVFSVSAILVMATSLVLTGSRSGLASLIVGLAVLAALSAGRVQGRWRRGLPTLAFAFVILAAVGWAGVARTAARFDRAGEELSERMLAWRDTITIARDFPIAGTGVGGYGRAMLIYQTAPRHSMYAQAHNDYLQVLAEGGLLVALPGVIVLMVIGRSIRHRFTGGDTDATFWLRAGAVGGLAGIGAQSLMDFSLQMPGNVMMFVFLLAVALHRPSVSADAHRL